MSREKKGILLIIIAIFLIIILIAACLLGIICPPPPPSDQIIATAFIRPPGNLEIPKEPYFGLLPDDFIPDENTRNMAIQRLEDLDFGILNVGKYSITFNGTKDNFEETFNTEIETVRYSPIGEDFLREIENAQNPPEPGSIRTTFTYMEALTNPIGVNQLVFLHFGITDETGSPGIGWEGLTIDLIWPDGTTDTLGSFTTNSTGTLVTTYTPTQIGTYIFQARFPEQISPQGAIMLESFSDPLELVVQAEPIFADPIYPESGSVKTTIAYVLANPNPTQVDQQVYLHFGITDATTGIGWDGLEVTITAPDATPSTITGIMTDSTGGTVTTFFPTQVGSYSLQAHFPEQTSPEGTTMLASISNPLELLVTEDPDPPITDPIFTEFSSPYEDFIQIVENTSDVELEDFIPVSYQADPPITIPENLKNYVDGVELPTPIYFSFDISEFIEIENSEFAIDPNPYYYNLKIPDELNDKLNVRGPPNWPIPNVLNGKGIKVAVIDSGFYNHSFFTKNTHFDVDEFSTSEDENYANISVIGSWSPLDWVEGDTIGHGTVVAANLLSVAPKVDLSMVKMVLSLNRSTKFTDPCASFELALDTAPDIISCSYSLNHFHWGLQHLIKEAIKDNITVVYACGNYKENIDNQPPKFPGDIPEVICVGGAYPLPPDEEGDWIAASYARSGPSSTYNNENCNLFGDDNCLVFDDLGNVVAYIDSFGVKRPIPRICPDVCGIVGQQPHGQIIMSPSGFGVDVWGSIDHHDGTKPWDHWTVLSGTSSAAPQVAGAVALMLQIKSDLTPAEIKDILEITATDVKSGMSASGIDAEEGASITRTYNGPQGTPESATNGPEIHGPDNATGYGVIDVHGAIQETINRLDEYVIP